MSQKRDYYEVLGVDKNASSSELKTAYRTKAKQLHPDINKSPDAETKFKELNEAYDVLRDENKKRAYDQFGHNANAHQSNFNNQGGNFGGFNFNEGFDFSDLNEVFGNFFDFGRGQGSVSNVKKIEIDFFHAVNGGKFTFSNEVSRQCSFCNGTGAENNDFATCAECKGRGAILRSIGGIFQTSMPCPRCRGKGKIILTKCKSCRGKKIHTKLEDIVIQIPASIKSKECLKIMGKGGVNKSGQIADLIVQVIVKEHKVFKISENDIYVEVPVLFTKVITGSTIKVPTLDGYKEINLPPNLVDGMTIKLRGEKGLKITNSKFSYTAAKKYGGFFVKIKIIFPPKSDFNREQLAYLNKINSALKDKNYLDYLSKINKIYN